MHFRQILHKVLSNPNFNPPEYLLDLNLRGSFKDLLESCPKKTCVRFAVDEAKLVLPIFEDAYPDDDRPRKAILAAEKWLRDPKVRIAEKGVRDPTFDAAIEAACAVTTTVDFDRIASHYAAYAASNAAKSARTDWIGVTNHAVYAVYTSDYVKRADPSITLEDQIRRLLAF